MRLTGPLRGVSFHSPLPPAMRAKSRADLIDCRLALALGDLAASLVPRGIAEHHNHFHPELTTHDGVLVR